MINTTAALIDLAKARAGEISMPLVTHISLGIGGLDGGVPRTPSPAETELVDEVIIKAVTFIGRTANKNVFEIGLDSSEANGSAISEMGVWSGATLIAIDTFTAKNKDSNTVQTYRYEEEF